MASNPERVLGLHFFGPVPLMGLVEVIKGVNPGEVIVADGAFLLKSDVLRSKMGAGCAD
jgi:3-hydroxyacyl-CoA dehydrogenase